MMRMACCMIAHWYGTVGTLIDERRDCDCVGGHGDGAAAEGRRGLAVAPRLGRSSAGAAPLKFRRIQQTGVWHGIALLVVVDGVHAAHVGGGHAHGGHMAEVRHLRGAEELLGLMWRLLQRRD